MTNLTAIRRAVRQAARANGATLAVLFGSHARGTATRHSDVDVIFVEETNDRFLDRLVRYMIPLSEALHEAIEVLVYTPAEFEDMKDRAFVRRALQEGIILYESGKKRTTSRSLA
ncbi:MAG: nucleotidyltransferase domain-containing protein [Planctomycetaceae bacterium]